MPSTLAHVGGAERHGLKKVSNFTASSSWNIKDQEVNKTRLGEWKELAGLNVLQKDRRSARPLRFTKEMVGFSKGSGYKKWFVKVERWTFEVGGAWRLARCRPCGSILAVPPRDT